MLKPMDKMTWLDLYNFLHQQANCSKNMGNFDWQSEIKVFDLNIGEHYDANLIQFEGEKTISISIDTDVNILEKTNDE